jgi:hypothetical protein
MESAVVRDLTLCVHVNGQQFLSKKIYIRLPDAILEKTVAFMVSFNTDFQICISIGLSTHFISEGRK